MSSLSSRSWTDMANPSTTVELISQIGPAIGWPVIVGIAWKLSNTLGTMKAQIELIMTNHLPHIYDELKQMRADSQK